MAFAVHVSMERCSGCGNCVTACPVNALELYSLDPVTNQKIYAVRDGLSINLDLKAELCAGCGVCIEACAMDVIRLSVRRGAGSPVLTLPAEEPADVEPGEKSRYGPGREASCDEADCWQGCMSMQGISQ
jgi:4Fe-4S ferredoxin